MICEMDANQNQQTQQAGNVFLGLFKDLVAAGALKDVQEIKQSLQQVGTSAHSAENL